MVYTEYNEIEERKLVRKEGFDEGFDEGRASMMIETVNDFVQRLNISEEEACKMLNYNFEKFLYYKELSLTN